MKTKIYVSGKYIQRNNKYSRKKRKRNNIVEEKRARKAKKLGLFKEDGVSKAPKVIEEAHLGMVLDVDRGGAVDQAHEAHVVDENGNIVVRVVYDPSIQRGAKVWVETELEVKSIVNKY